ncbi:MAG TPA: hypothetical protein VGB33_07465 [Acidimicrobiia bacterium]
MSDLLQAASDALGAPTDLVRRSAAARATVNGTTVDDVLSAWSGGAPAVSAPAPPAELDVGEEPASAPAPEPIPASVTVVEPVPPATPAPPEDVYPPEPEAELDPVPLSTRLKTAVRVGAWTGAALGVIGFLAVSAFWAPNAAVSAEGTPVVVVRPSTVLIGIALVSVVFGAVVAGVSRAATGWTNPAMQLSGSKAATVWLGAGIGLILGVVAGALLSSVGTAVEGSDPPLTQLPVLATLFVMVVGGAFLGSGTALIPQLLGVPVAVDESDREEMATVKRRLGNAMSIPVAGLLILLTLVLPFAYALIRTNELAENGGAIVAVIAAAGILGFSALAGTKPEMRISPGDLIVALVGIGVVLVIIIAVLSYAGGNAEGGEGPGDAVAIIASLDLTFDATSWTVEEGDIEFTYTDDGDSTHTLLIEGHEDELELRVEGDGDVDAGTIKLAPGTYTVYCGITGHRDAGMEGTLTVGSAPPA